MNPPRWPQDGNGVNFLFYFGGDAEEAQPPPPPGDGGEAAAGKGARVGSESPAGDYCEILQDNLVTSQS